MTIQSAAFLSGVRRLAPDQFVEGILSGNRRVLSRFITLLESRLVEDRRLAQHVKKTARAMIAFPVTGTGAFDLNRLVLQPALYFITTKKRLKIGWWS